MQTALPSSQGPEDREPGALVSASLEPAPAASCASQAKRARIAGLSSSSLISKVSRQIPQRIATPPGICPACHQERSNHGKLGVPTSGAGLVENCLGRRDDRVVVAEGRGHGRGGKDQVMLEDAALPPVEDYDGQDA